MRTQIRDIRCQGCSILLAKLDETGLTIRRNDLEVHYGGPGLVTIRCYRSGCRRLNAVRIPAATTQSGTEVA